MRCACIDIGSNTTRVLVADVGGGRLSPVVEVKAYTELGRDLRASGAVSEARMRRLAEVVAEQRAHAEGLAAERVRVVGTAALRGAANRDAVLDAVRERCGAPVELLPGEDEARLAFRGAVATLGHVPRGVLAVVDVGGGSTEIALGTPDGGVEWSVSVPLGSGVLTEAHARADPPSAEEVAAMRQEAAAAIEPLDVARPDEAVAVGGSATSLCRMGGGMLEPEALTRALAAVCGAPAADIARRVDLDPERVRLLPAGILLLDAAARRLGRPLQVGSGGLREGVCLEIAESTAS